MAGITGGLPASRTVWDVTSWIRRSSCAGAGRCRSGRHRLDSEGSIGDRILEFTVSSMKDRILRFVSGKKMRIATILWTVWMTTSGHLDAQSSNGFIRFAGKVETVSEDGDRVTLGIGVFGATVPVELDEHSTVSGSLGGRTSSRALKVGVYVEVEGWMRSDGSVRASEVELKVQTGSIRMTGPIENILDVDGVQSVLINGIEFRLDAGTKIVVERAGVAQTGTLAELAIGTEIDIAGSQLDRTGGLGPSTGSVFRADRIVAFRFFRLQGTIDARIPSTGNPSVLVVQGIAVTLTPDTSISGNGLNERNEAFLSRDVLSTGIVSRIEDDAGDPCGILNPTDAEVEQQPNCPDRAPSNPLEAGDLQLGAAVRIEGLLEPTGFSTRFTARAIQVERMSSHIRFQGVVTLRTAAQVWVQISVGIATPVVIDAFTRFEGTVQPGTHVEVSAEMDADLSLRARRIKEIP